MPHENVHATNSTPNESMGVQIQWHKENLPELGDGWVNVAAGYFDKMLPVGSASSDDPDCPNQFVNLDRAGINRLISRLRRARDAAYGADA